MHKLEYFGEISFFPYTLHRTRRALPRAPAGTGSRISREIGHFPPAAPATRRPRCPAAAADARRCPGRSFLLIPVTSPNKNAPRRNYQTAVLRFRYKHESQLRTSPVSGNKPTRGCRLPRRLPAPPSRERGRCLRRRGAQCAGAVSTQAQ